MLPERELTIKGETKFFFEEENIDRLFAMVMALGAEISVLGEKLDTVVRLLEDGGIVTRSAIAGFEPDEIARAERDAAMTGLVDTLLAPFRDAATALAERAASLKG